MTRRTKTEAVRLALREGFEPALRSAARAKFQIELEARWDMFAQRMVTTRADEAPLTQGELLWIAGFEMAWLLATGVGVDAEGLRPCPFCGSGRVTVWNVRDGQQAVCKDCRSTGASEFNGPAGMPSARDRAVAAWNRRAEPTPPAPVEGGWRPDPEAVARIIDPKAWTRRQERLDRAEHWVRNPAGFAPDQAKMLRAGNLAGADDAVRASLKLAAAILALPSSTGPAPTRSGER